MDKKVFLFICASILINLVSVLCANAQVTIGAGEEPVDGALLQLKNVEQITNDGSNAYKGFNLPRVSLSSLSDLYPMFLTDPNDPDSGSNADYDTDEKKDQLDLAHTGLMVYNVAVDPLIPLVEGIYTWDGNQWVQATTEYSNPIKRLRIDIGTTTVTETLAYYGTLEFSETAPDIDDYSLLNVVPIVSSSANFPNFVPENLFFSTSIRREAVSGANNPGNNRVVWKVKIENNNQISSNPDMYANIEGVYILYTSTGGEFTQVGTTNEVLWQGY